MPEKFQSRCGAPSQRPWTVPIARGVSRGAAGRAASRFRHRRRGRPSACFARLRVSLALCRVDIGVDDAAAIGADEAGPADATCRIDGAAGVAALRGLRRIDVDDPGSVSQNLYACIQLSERNGTSASKKPCHVRDARRDILKVTGCTDGQGTNSARDITAPRPDAYVGPWQDRATRRAAARRRGRIRRPSRSGHNTTRSAQS